MRPVFAFTVFVLVLSSCGDNRIYEENKEFQTRAWLADDTANFEFDVQDGAALYNVHYNLRNTIEYPFSRIFINFVLADSTGQVLASKLVSNYLFEPKTGKPFGQSGLGDIYDHRFPLINAYALKPGKYFVTLQQFMRVDTLSGVLAAGVRVERAE